MVNLKQNGIWGSLSAQRRWFKSNLQRYYTSATAIFLLALVVRLSFVFLCYGFETPQPIFSKYVVLAEKLIANGWVFERVFGYSPLYVYYNAVAMTLFAGNLTWMLIAQAFFGALNCLLIFFLARRLFGKKEALIAGIVASLFHHFLLYESEFLSDFFGSLLLCSALLLVLKAIRRQSHRFSALAGLSIGLAALQRPTALLLMPVAVFWLAYSLKGYSVRARTYMSLTAVLGALLSILPVTLHNYVVEKDFVPIMSSGGYVLYSSNNYASTGAQYYPPKIRYENETAHVGPYVLTNMQFYDDDLISRYIASKVLGRQVSASEAASFWLGETKRYIWQHPVEFITLLKNKLLFALHSYEVHDLYSVIQKRSTYANPVWDFTDKLLLPLGLLGLLLALRRWRDTLPVILAFAVQVAIILCFYITSRYKLPFFALVIVFASFGAFEMSRTFSRLTQHKRKATFMSVLLLALVVLCNYGYAPVQKQQQMEAMAIAVHKGQQLAYTQPNFAIRLLNQAVHMDPIAPKAFVAHRALSEIYHRLDKHELAQEERSKWVKQHPAVIEAAKKRIIADPHNARAHHLLALVYMGEAKYDKAVTALTNALSEQPAHPRIRTHLAQALIGLGADNFYSALIELEKALEDGEKLVNESSVLHLKAALLCRRLGLHAKAKAHLEQCIFEKPDLLEARYVYQNTLTDLGLLDFAQLQQAVLYRLLQQRSDMQPAQLSLANIESKFLFR